MRNVIGLTAACLLTFATATTSMADEATGKAGAGKVTFPLGTATPSEVCGNCHSAIYREYAFGFGSDQNFRATFRNSTTVTLPDSVSSRATSHSLAGIAVEQANHHAGNGAECNACHYPESFSLPRTLDVSENDQPKAGAGKPANTGLSCAACHLTPDGRIRGPYNIASPHDNQPDITIKTSLMCAYCHSLGKRTPGSQTQTFLEWRDDFFLKGLGRQNCQDCHMPHTVRRLSNDQALPERVSSRHLWTGGRSLQRLLNALSQVIVQTERDRAQFSFHIINIGAGHSVPTGSHRRAVYLQAEAVTGEGKIIAEREWLFAPWYGNRPDDSRYLEEDKKRPDARGVSMADAQGPHEAIIRAGEERVLDWSPKLPAGRYAIRSRLVYDLNRYNDRNDRRDQTLFHTTSLEVTVK